jgi:hypothetical protein
MARIALAEGKPELALAPLAAGQAVVRKLSADDAENVNRAAQVRLFDLVRLRAWLDMPPERRPPADQLAAANGDCADDRLRLKNEELALLCNILAAHRTGQTPPEIVPAADGSRLSAGWGFDFVAEARRTPRQ